MKILTNGFRENTQYKKFLLLIEVVPAMTKLLQRAGLFAGPEFSIDLDTIVSSNRLISFHFTDLRSLQIDSGRKQARRVDVSGIRNAIAQWPCIEWNPVHPGIHFYLLGFNHDTSGGLLCPVTLNWLLPRYVFFHWLGLYSQVLSVREDLRRGTFEVTAYDLPTFLWPNGAFDIHDTYKGFLRSELLITVSVSKSVCDFTTLIILRHTNMFL